MRHATSAQVELMLGVGGSYCRRKSSGSLSKKGRALKACSCTGVRLSSGSLMPSFCSLKGIAVVRSWPGKRKGRRKKLLEVKGDFRILFFPDEWDFNFCRATNKGMCVCVCVRAYTVCV